MESDSNPKYMRILYDFTFLSLTSVILGITFGLSATLLLKYLNKARPDQECAVLFAIAYLSYLLAESLSLSGIIALFCCGATMSHYAYSNLSPSCRTGSVLAVETVSSVAEGFLYVYLGMTAVGGSIKTQNVNLFLIIYTIAGTLMARFSAVMGILGVMSWFQKEKGGKLLGFNERVLIAAGGTVRGAIAFGLAL